MPKLAVSPSRVYVAVCYKSHFDGLYFKKFTLPTLEERIKEVTKENWLDEPTPELIAHVTKVYSNDTEFAAWYFLNILDGIACIDYCITFEDYQNLTEVE